MKEMLVRVFKLEENGTDIRTEIMGGVTAFFAMAYIIFVNSGMLSETGMNFNALVVATCVASAIGCFLTAFLANVPFSQAPGMGLNAFFTYTLCFGMGYTWQQALSLVFASGLLFLIVVLTPVKRLINEAIPTFLKSAISCGIGLFIALIGMFNAGIVVTTEAGIMDLGNLANSSTFLAIIGLIICAVLFAYQMKGALIVGIAITTLIGLVTGVTTIPDNLTMQGSFWDLLCAFDFSGAIGMGVLPLVTSILTLFMCDMFDTLGTLTGASAGTGIFDGEEGKKRFDKSMIADALATTIGATVGTSNVTTFVESSSAIVAGARTGLSSLVVGILFLISCVFAPVAGIVPSAATAPALILVGVFMMKNALHVAWDNLEEAIPAFLTIAVMPFGYSISDGIGFGFISYTLIKVLRGKGGEVKPFMYVISVAFLLLYVVQFVL